MIVGIPKEIKNGESRVGLTPVIAHDLKSRGHTVLVEKSAGKLAGFTDQEYRQAGATLLNSTESLWKKSQLILKVKEPQPQELKFLSNGQILFCYLHLAANLSLTQALLKLNVSAVAFETVQNLDGRLPLLESMSEVAGKMAGLIGAYYQATPSGGSGILLTGLAHVRPAQVTILGGGTVGENAARVTSALGAFVTVIDHREEKLKVLKKRLPKNVSFLKYSSENVARAIQKSNILIGAVLNPGAKAPKLITRKMLKRTRPGTVLVDVCIDQGGVSETSRPTTHSHPVYKECGVLHYCVANMPGAYGHSSTLALAQATRPYILMLAEVGLEKALSKNSSFARGLNIYKGNVTREEVARSLHIPFQSWTELVPSPI